MEKTIGWGTHTFMCRKDAIIKRNNIDVDKSKLLIVNETETEITFDMLLLHGEMLEVEEHDERGLLRNDFFIVSDSNLCFEFIDESNIFGGRSGYRSFGDVFGE